MVPVTDLLPERTENGWEQKVSSYEKVRVTSGGIKNVLKDLQMKVRFRERSQGLEWVIVES